MALTEAQRTVLATDIRASSDPDVVAALAIRNDPEMARLYNLDSAFVVWNPSVQPEEYRAVMAWTEVDQLTTGNARIWEWITSNMTLTLDTSDQNVRQGLADAFSQNSTNRANLLALAKIIATVAQELYATGTGTTATPGDYGSGTLSTDPTVSGNITFTDVGKALNENP